MVSEHPIALAQSTVESAEAYRYGTILESSVEEAKKSQQGRRMIQERVLSLGKDSVFNLTGLVRTFPLRTEDLPALENQFTFYAYFMGEAEELAIEQMGGHPSRHGAVITNRVTSGMLAIMLALIERGDRVLSVVPKGRSHPCVQQSVELAGGAFHEIVGVDGLEEALSQGTWKMLVITPLTPSKYHLPAADVRRAIALAKEADLLVCSDDAHMVSRCVFHRETATFAIGDIDVAIWSIDKHVPGPRGAAVVAKRDLMDSIQAKAFQFGVEAQSGHYVAMLRGMQALDTRPVEEASALARLAFTRFQNKYGERVYQAGPGIAFPAEEFADLVIERAGDGSTELVPGEISITACFLMLQSYGIITIPITGYPGAASTLRLMMHPDGARLGLDRLEEAVEAAIDSTIGLLQRPDEVRRLLLGAE